VTHIISVLIDVDGENPVVNFVVNFVMSEGLDPRLAQEAIGAVERRIQTQVIQQEAERLARVMAQEAECQKKQP